MPQGSKKTINFQFLVECDVNSILFVIPLVHWSFQDLVFFGSYNFVLLVQVFLSKKLTFAIVPDTEGTFLAITPR